MSKLKNNKGFLADISVGSNFYALLPRLPNTNYGALAEFIDNSISSYIKNRNLPENDPTKYNSSSVDVQLKFDRSAERIDIIDNASGISKEDLPRALKPLEPPETFDNTLNEHGYGMKGAAGWFAKKFTIYTSVFGDPIARTITYEFDKIVAEKLKEIPIKEEKASKKDHFTIITLEKFNDKRFPHTNSMKTIQSHLSDIYRAFIREKTLNLKFNDMRIQAMDVKIQTTHHHSAVDKDTGKLKKGAWKILWKKKFALENLGKNNQGIQRSVTGFGALKKDGSHTIHSGMAIFNNGRILKGSGKNTNKPQELYGSGNTYRSLRLTGEIHLHKFDTTASKDDLIWGDLQEEDLYKKIYKSLSGNKENFLKLYNERSVKESELNESMPLLDQIENIRETINIVKKPIPMPAVPQFIKPEKVTDTDSEKDIEQVLADAQNELKDLDISTNRPEVKKANIEPFDEKVFDDHINSEKPWEICVNTQDYLIHFKNEVVNPNDLYSVITNDDDDPIKVIIHINSRHEFVHNFLGPIHKEPVSVFLRLIVSLAITEITLPQIYGHGKDVPVADFREYFNNYLTNHLSMIEIN